ncbi:MAG TPA: redoxin domain-containing protein [Puia sp.]|nr:redoxin domain-containing protein [Puia sp.]
MKKAFLLLALLVGGAAVQAQKFVLTGTARGEEGAMIHLSYHAAGGELVQDSCVVKNGAFRFSGSVSGPEAGSLYDGKAGGHRWTRLFLEPADMHIVIPDGDFDKAIVTGSVTESEYQVLQRATRKVEVRWKVVMDTLTEVNKRSNFAYQELKDWVLTPYFAEMKEIYLTFFNRHPFSYVTATMLEMEGRDLTTDSLQLFYDRFPGKIKRSDAGKEILAELGKRKIAVPGTKAPDFETTDVNGGRVALADLRGKVVLLDFWASWCLPCRKSSPHLKELYAEYNSRGLAIIGIASDDDRPEAWKKAIAQDSVGLFYQVLSGFNMQKKMAGKTNPADIGEKYNIASLPTKILIDKDGTIIGRYDDEGTAAMDKKLAELFHSGAARSVGASGPAGGAGSMGSVGPARAGSAEAAGSTGAGSAGAAGSSGAGSTESAGSVGSAEAAASLGADGSFVLSGEVEGQREGRVYLTYALTKGKYVQDSAELREGRFRFTGMLNEPTMAFFHGRILSQSMDDPNATEFFIGPGNMNLTLNAGDFKHAVLKGSPVQDEYKMLVDSKLPVEAQYRVQLDSLAREKDHDAAAAIRERLAPYFDAIRQKDYDFFDAHPRSYVTAYMLRFHVDDLSLNSLQRYYDGLGDEIRQSAMGREIAVELEKLRAGSPGSIAKDFTAKDIDDQTLTLSAFRGRSYVLIDFWASWCAPCRKSNPHLIELFRQYHDKGFDVIGVSDDDGHPAAWKAAVEKDGVGIWHNVLRGLDWAKLRSGEPNENDISEKFGIHSLPTKILIDKKGVIIGRYGEGRDDEAALDNKLSEIFL